MHPATGHSRLQKSVLVGAVALGVAAGSYGIASAADGGSGAGASSGATLASRAARTEPGRAWTPVDIRRQV